MTDETSPNAAHRAQIKSFILLVEVHFPRPKFNGDEAKEALWLKSMEAILAEYDPSILAEAAETIIRTRNPEKTGGTMFPKPSECIEVCERIRGRERTYAMIAEASDMASEASQRRLAHSRNLPEHTIRRGDLTWENWIDHLSKLGDIDRAQEADRLGVVRVSSLWPRDDSVIFEPKASAQLPLELSRLRTMPMN